MMYQKAKVFHDKPAMQAVLATKSPSVAKSIGRKVRGFDKERWEQVCLDIIYRGNRLKFEQNPKLMDELKATTGKKLVECSKFDLVWGNGISLDDPARWNEDKWRGTNWLGEILTELREDFINGSLKNHSSQEYF
jgi:ribA/ribD-fused uncharacterized protein